MLYSAKICTGTNHSLSHHIFISTSFEPSNQFLSLIMQVNKVICIRRVIFIKTVYGVFLLEEGQDGWIVKGDNRPVRYVKLMSAGYKSDIAYRN